MGVFIGPVQAARDRVGDGAGDVAIDPVGVETPRRSGQAALFSELGFLGDDIDRAAGLAPPEQR